MNKPLPKKINIFLSLQQDIFKGYFNAQDPAPLYKKQLSHEFEEYIMNSIRSAKRDAVFNYKIFFGNEKEQSFAEPLMYAIRRHFGEKKAQLVAEFEKFKRRTYRLLFFSLAMVMVCKGIVPLLVIGHDTIESGLSNSMDVLCWVILWKPIDRLIFYWNPFLKDISIIGRLESGEALVMETTE